MLEVVIIACTMFLFGTGVWILLDAQQNRGSLEKRLDDISEELYFIRTHLINNPKD